MPKTSLRIRWAPFPGTGPERVTVLKSGLKHGTALVRWLTGPLAGREARLVAATLKINRHDVKRSES